jgi:predicted RecB family nuclease
MKRMGREEEMAGRRIPMLSKSRFIAGLQCPLRLWYQCYNRDLATPVSLAQQAIFDTGNEVGRLATELYPGGVLIEEDHLHHREAVESTRAAMADPAVPAIYEAGFIHDSVRVRVDVLERLPGGKWNLIEVKSSTSAKEVHLPDVAIQYRVLKGKGLDVARAGVLHLNNEYVYDGRRLDLERFFIFTDLTREAIDHQGEVQANLRRLKEELAGETPPEIQPGRHCSSPYRCEFWEHCTASKSSSWVMNLSGISQKKLNELAALDVEEIYDIPEDFPLTALQARIRECVAEGKEYVSPELADELRDIEYPIHFLDFETIGPAIPRYEGTRPYQAIPFQWSDHILHEDGTIEHPEFLHDEDTDPREEFCRTLLETLGDSGTIVIYTTYEVGIMTNLADEFPEYAGRLMAALDRIKDLHAVVKTYFYHPDFRGSFSLKRVLPALVPSMAYEGLSIQEGTEASLEYLRMLDPSTRPEEKKRIREDLLIYCGHDTLAMVRIREELLKRF